MTSPFISHMAFSDSPAEQNLACLRPGPGRDGALTTWESVDRHETRVEMAFDRLGRYSQTDADLAERARGFVDTLGVANGWAVDYSALEGKEAHALLEDLELFVDRLASAYPSTDTAGRCSAYASAASLLRLLEERHIELGTNTKEAVFGSYASPTRGVVVTVVFVPGKGYPSA